MAWRSIGCGEPSCNDIVGTGRAATGHLFGRERARPRERGRAGLDGRSYRRIPGLLREPLWRAVDRARITGPASLDRRGYRLGNDRDRQPGLPGAHAPAARTGRVGDERARPEAGLE